MLQNKFLILIVSLTVLNIHGAELPQKRGVKEEKLQTYVIDSDDVQIDPTTIIPPLLETDQNAPIVGNSDPTKFTEDPLQPYVNPYGPYYPGPYPNNYYPSLNGYPWFPYALQSSYLQQLNAMQNSHPNIIPMQTEYEGILVPVYPEPKQPQQETQPTVSKTKQTQSNLPIHSNDIALVLRSLFPPNVIQTAVAWASFILNSFSLVALAGIITSAICSLTPICTLSFGALPLSVKRKFISNFMTEGGKETNTIQRVRRAAQMLSTAINKYETLQTTVNSLNDSLNKS